MAVSFNEVHKTSAKIEGFLHGFTCAGLFGKLNPPGRPEEYELATTFLGLGAAAFALTLCAVCYFVVMGPAPVGYVFLGLLIVGQLLGAAREIWLSRNNR